MLPCTQPSGPQLWPQEDLSIPSVSQGPGPTHLCIQMPRGWRAAGPMSPGCPDCTGGLGTHSQKSLGPEGLPPPHPLPRTPLLVACWGVERQALVHGGSRSSDSTLSAPAPSLGGTAGSAPGTLRPGLTDRAPLPSPRRAPRASGCPPHTRPLGHNSLCSLERVGPCRVLVPSSVKGGD